MKRVLIGGLVCVGLLALVVPGASGASALDGTINLDSTGVEGAYVFLLSSGAIGSTTTSGGAFAFANLGSGLFLVTSLINASGASTVNGELYKYGTPARFTPVLFLSLNGPSFGLVGSDGSYSVNANGGTWGLELMVGFNTTATLAAKRR